MCFAYCTGMDEKQAHQTGVGWYLPIHLSQVPPGFPFRNFLSTTKKQQRFLCLVSSLETHFRIPCPQ